MPKQSVSQWSIPYLSLFSILTKDDSTFSRKIHRMRHLLRLSAGEIFSSLLQATLVISLFKALQSYLQNAFFMLQKGQDIGLISTQFYGLAIRYFLVLQATALFDAYLRMWRNQYFARHAKKLAEYTIDVTDEHTFHSALAAPIIRNNRSAAGSFKTLKAYYQVSQSFIKAPLELITYLCMLGPTLLFCIAILSLLAAHIQNKIRAYRSHNRKAYAILQKRAYSSEHENHTERIHHILLTESAMNRLDTQGMHSTVAIRHIFQFTLLVTCGYFVFSGAYTLAMMSAQLSAAPEAFKRITDYLSLVKDHGDLEATTEDHLDAASLKPFKGMSLDNGNSYHIVNEIEAYKTLMRIKQDSDNLVAIFSESKCYTQDTDAQYLAAATLLSIQTLLADNEAKDEADRLSWEVLDRNILDMIATYEATLDNPHAPLPFGATIYLLSREDLNEYIAQQDSAKESLYNHFSSSEIPFQFLLMGIPGFLAWLILPTTVLPTIASLSILPAMSLGQQTLLGLIGLFSLNFLSYDYNIKNISIDIPHTILGGLWVGIQLLSTYRLYQLGMTVLWAEHAITVGTLLCVAYPLALGLQRYCLPSLLFAAKALGTWIAQELVSLTQMPIYITRLYVDKVLQLGSKRAKSTPIFADLDLPLPGYWAQNSARHL